MIDKLCFTTCLNEGFIPGAKGTISSIRKFYKSEEADIVVFIDKKYEHFETFCKNNSVEIQYFSDIQSWVLEKIYSQDRYKNDKTHYYHPEFVPHEKVQFSVDKNREVGFHKIHHLHPLNVKAYCTGYCILIKDYSRVIHIDSDAFILSRIDEIFDTYKEDNTVIAFDDGDDDLINLEYLYETKKQKGWDRQTYGINAGVVFYRNGEYVKKLMEDFCFYIDSKYHYHNSGHFNDQGILRSLIASYHIKNLIYFYRHSAINWNPTFQRANCLEFKENIWINKNNNEQQRIWHAAGLEKLWSGKNKLFSINEAWKWIGGEFQQPPINANKKLLIVPSFLQHHFGDILNMIAEIERLHNEGYDIWIGDIDRKDVHERYLEYISIYDLNWKYRLTGYYNKNYEWSEWTQLFKNPAPRPILKHDSNKIYKRITYTRDANYMREQKLDPQWDKMWGKIKNIEWIEINKSTGNILTCQKLIAESDLFIGVDNGVSHMAKSVGTPMILLEYKFGLERAFPSNIVKYTKAKTNNEVLILIYNYYRNKGVLFPII